MEKGKKVAVFMATVAILGAVAWFSQGENRGDFTDEMTEMQNMQSRIIGNNLTDSDLDKLKTAAADAAARKTKFIAWRTADETAIRTLFTQYGLQTEPYNQLKTTIESTRDTYLNGSMTITKISTLLPAWSSIDANSDTIARTFKNSTKTTKQADYTKLQKLSKSVNDLSHDIGLMTTYISSYDTMKPRFCTTDDATNNVATLGTVRMYISGTQIKDVCDGSSVKQVACVKNRVTLWSDGKPVATSTTCPNSCGNGICLGGSIGALSTVTSTGAALTDIATGQVFYVKAASVSISTGQNLTADLTLPAGCSQTGSNSISIASATTNVQFGPINCTTAGTKALKVDLKNGSSIVQTQNMSVAITQNTADEIRITVPTLRANTPFTATITVYGENGNVYTDYTKDFYISLVGAGDGTTFPEGLQTFTNGVASVSGLIFDTATTGTNNYTIKVTTEDRSLEKEVEVTVGA